MYLDQLSDDEFVRYVSLANTDPVVSRLLVMLTDPERPKNRLMELMTYHGMDPDTLGIRDQNGFYSGIDEYLRSLEFELEQAAEVRRDLEDQLETQARELDQFRNLTIGEFIEHARNRVQNAEDEVAKARREFKHQLESMQAENHKLLSHNREITEKLNMWSTLQQVN